MTDEVSDQNATIERLEKELESERETSAKLRLSLENLDRKVASVQDEFERRFEDVQARARKAESKLSDQSARLNVLGAGREESMRELNETRAELARVAAERDKLQRQLVSVEEMQTETIALSDEDPDSGAVTQDALPTIEELMANLNIMMEEAGQDGRAPELGQALEAPDGEWQEMISPELMAPEEFVRREAEQEVASSPERCRLLVYLGDEQPIRYPIHKEVTTIGRAESADIQIEGDFISRVHARIVSAEGKTYIEDAGSKNGIKLNYEHVQRRELQHGDVIGFGRLRFTYIDSGGLAPD
jgi:hypothetical protein